MSRYYLSQEEICDIDKILGRLLIKQNKHQKMKESLLYMILEWLRKEGVDMNSLEMIVKNIPPDEMTITERVLNQEIWQIFSASQCDNTSHTETIRRDSSCLYKTLTEVNAIDFICHTIAFSGSPPSEQPATCAVDDAHNAGSNRFNA